MDLSRSDASDLSPSRRDGSLRPGPLAELDQVLQAIYGALMSAMVSIQTYSVRAENNAIPTPDLSWPKTDDKRLDRDGLSRSEIVRLQLEKLKEASTPSCPLCFKCGQPGHIAIQCRNEILCFVCNRFGHRSMECRLRTTHIPFSPQPAQTNQMPYHKSIPVSCEISVMASVKRLEMELTEIKHELALMTKRRDAMAMDMEGIKSHSHSNQSNLVELKVAKVIQKSGQGTKPDNHQPLRSDYDNEIGENIKGKASISAICTSDMKVSMTPIVIEGSRDNGVSGDKGVSCINAASGMDRGKGSSNNAFSSQGTKSTHVQDPFKEIDSGSDSIEDNRQPQQNGEKSYSTKATIVTSPVGTVPATQRGQDSWSSQIVRTKARSDSKEMNKVALSREKRSIQFKRATSKSRERDVRLKPMEIAAIQIALLFAVTSGNTNCFTVCRS